MAEDGLFFRSVAYVNARTRVPIVAIILQSVWTAVIALSGRYDQILNYVVATDFIFFGLTATCVFIFRRREAAAGREQQAAFRTPGHPFTTAAFVLACWLVVADTIYKYPSNSLIGTLILLLGIPVYLLWSRRNKVETAP
jgi:APA family basic amino acid/polyamine antiporter